MRPRLFNDMFLHKGNKEYIGSAYISRPVLYRLFHHARSLDSLIRCGRVRGMQTQVSGPSN